MEHIMDESPISHFFPGKFSMKTFPLSQCSLGNDMGRETESQKQYQIRVESEWDQSHGQLNCPSTLSHLPLQKGGQPAERCCMMQPWNKGWGLFPALRTLLAGSPSSGSQMCSSCACTERLMLPLLSRGDHSHTVLILSSDSPEHVTAPKPSGNSGPKA